MPHLTLVEKSFFRKALPLRIFQDSSIIVRLISSKWLKNNQVSSVRDLRVVGTRRRAWSKEDVAISRKHARHYVVPPVDSYPGAVLFTSAKDTWKLGSSGEKMLEILRAYNRWIVRQTSGTACALHVGIFLSTNMRTTGRTVTNAACVQFRSTYSSSRLAQHTLFCIASVVLGFRISQGISLVVDTANWSEESDTLAGVHLSEGHDALPHPDARLPDNASRKTGVQVGRHRILVREWPHPDPTDTLRAYGLIARVQEEQRRVHGVQDWKPVIAITPTYPRMFQALHLTGLMHTLSIVRAPVTWIVVEAGGVSEATAEILDQAQVHSVVHLGYPKPMPLGFESRWIMESHMRVEGLRFVREKELEGVVVFADDSNVYSMEFFNVIQRVNWVGVLPMGILGYAGFRDGKSKRRRRGSLLLGVVHKGQAPPKIDLQVQALAGNKTGWHAHRPLPLDWDSGKGTPLLDGRLQWAGFVIAARAVWAPPPPWLRDWNMWGRVKEGVYLDVRSIFKDESHLEELEGESGVVRHWWMRMEGRPDFKFPSRWALDSQPDVLLPARSTPWP